MKCGNWCGSTPDICQIVHTDKTFGRKSLHQKCVNHDKPILRQNSVSDLLGKANNNCA